MSKETEHINLRSEEVQEILGKIPSWTSRWGTLVIFIAIIGLVAVSAIVKYPEIVDAPIELTTDKPPVKVIAKQAGNIEQLLVSEEDSVTTGQLLAILQNTANESDLMQVEESINTFLENPANGNNIDFPESPELGNIQSLYSNFLTNFNDYKFFDQANVSASNVSYLKTQITQIESINRGLQNQKTDCAKELQNLSINVNKDRELLQNGVIAERDFQKTETLYFNKKSQCDAFSVQIASNQMQIQELKMQIFGLSSGEKENEIQKFIQLRESANQLQSGILLWKEQFLITAPTSGIVSLNEIYTNNQFINANDEVLTIIQPNGNIKTKALLTNAVIGKVKVGQHVNIQFPTYNYMQFGMVKGKVQSISSIPRDNTYKIEIALEDGLTTSYNKEIGFTQGMQGIAKIVTEKQSFLSRIGNKFKFLFTQEYE